MLSETHIKLIHRLEYLTQSGILLWKRHNSPTAFISLYDGSSFIVDTFNSKDKEGEYNCSEFAILKDGKMYEDLVFCNNAELIKDYKVLNGLYAVVKDKFSQENDNEIEHILDTLPA